MKRISILILISLLFVNASIAQKDKALESITQDEIKNHMYFLASDFLGGRISYKEGYKIASEYCAAQFRSVNLKPVFKDEKGKPSYFQKVPLVKRKFSENCDIDVSLKGKSFKLKHGDDFKLPDPIRTFNNTALDVVFAGYGISEPEYDWNDYKNIDIKGKAVVILMGTPKKNGEPILPEDIDKKYASMQGLQSKLGKLIEEKPIAVLIIPDQQLLKQFSWEMIPSQVGGEQVYYDGKKSEDGFSIPTFYAIKPEAAEKLFEGQKYSPQKAESGDMKGYKCFELKNVKLKSNFKIEKEEKINCNNIAAIVEGTDEKLKNEYLTVGAHLDHVPGPNGMINNGADDNASGSIGVLEVAEAFRYTPSKRSVIFILYAGEELGLLGSAHFLEHSPVPVENIVFNINLDMIGRSAGDNIKTRAHNVVIHDQFFPKVKAFVSEVNENSVKWPLNYSTGLDIGGDSDHSSYNNKGIPHVFFYSGHHKDLHRPTDDAEKIDYEKMQKISQLVYFLTYKLANTEELNFK